MLEVAYFHFQQTNLLSHFTHLHLHLHFCFCTRVIFLWVFELFLHWVYSLFQIGGWILSFIYCYFPTIIGIRVRNQHFKISHIICLLCYAFVVWFDCILAVCILFIVWTYFDMFDDSQQIWCECAKVMTHLLFRHADWWLATFPFHYWCYFLVVCS